MFQQHVSLKPYNTFGIQVYAEQFAEVSSVSQLRDVIARHKDVFVLSGGSNILLTGNVEKPVIHLNLKGIELTGTTDDGKRIVRVQAGENWHQFVNWCIEKDLGGVENLSLIPGNVGTSPMQNIGAYGVEIKDVFHELEAVEIETGDLVRFSKEDCHFGYRESVFKNELKGKYIIVSVSLILSTRDHTIRTDYGAIREELLRMGVNRPGIRDVSNAVISIRQSKLPDPAELGNSGSFFKNPVVSRSKFEGLFAKYQHMPHYAVGEEYVKIPAGWLVEQCGFKGYRIGDAGVHQKQALVLVNFGSAKGSELLDLARSIQREVANRFGIDLEMEVNVI